MNARSLARWGALDERRRRGSRSAVVRLPAIVWSLAGGAALAGWLAADASAGPRVVRLWLAAVVALSALVVFGAPFRMYWRRDSALLARLPIAGGALFRVGLERSVWAATSALAGPAVVALALVWLATPSIGLRHLALVAVAWSVSALLAPAAALAGGALVASDKLDQMMEQMGGEFRAPRTGWLGILPGLAAAGGALAVIAGADWALGAPRTAVGSAIVLLVPPVALALIGVAWAVAAADRVMLAAVREVSALDRERLAHIELTRASPLERAASRLIGAGARVLFDKDMRLARRRYPMPYFVSVTGVIAAWIVAAVRPEAMVAWTSCIVACLVVYGVIMARRRRQPPIEHPRLLRTLPFGDGDVAAAKGLASALWLVVFAGLAAVPPLLRAPDKPVLGAVLAAIVVAGGVASAIRVSAW